MKIKFRIYALLFLSIITASVVTNPIRVIAEDKNYEDFFSDQDIIFYDPKACSYTTENPLVIEPNAPPTSETSTSFTKKYVDSAYKIGRERGIPWEIIMAQAALESGWGNSKLTQNANNFFGIKAGSSWTGPVIIMPTKEQDSSGNVYTVNAAFRVYTSPEAGFNGYADFIHDNPRYSKALDYPNDMLKYITEIKNAGYATDVKYVQLVMSAAQSVINVLGTDYGAKYEKSSDIVYENIPGGSTPGGETPAPTSNSCICPLNPKSGDATGPGVFVGSNDAEISFNYFVSIGMSKAGAAGIVGNLMRETGGDGFDFKPESESGGYRGIAQWDAKDRWPKLLDWAAQNKLEPKNLEVQLQYIWHEINNNNSYSPLIQTLKSIQDPENAAREFNRIYERGAHADQRATNAKKAYETFSGNTPTTPNQDTPTNDVGTSTIPGCAGNGGDATIVGDFAFPLVGGKDVVVNQNMFKNGTASLGGHPYTAYDILANPGVQVVASMSGKVVSRDTAEDRCDGRLVSIHNPEQDITLTYMHLNAATKVQKDAEVKIGEPLGQVGSAADGCGTPHLHIDAIQGSVRYPCSRLSCPPSTKSKFIDIGKKLYDSFMAMPGGNGNGSGGSGIPRAL